MTDFHEWFNEADVAILSRDEARREEWTRPTNLGPHDSWPAFAVYVGDRRVALTDNPIWTRDNLQTDWASVIVKSWARAPAELGFPMPEFTSAEVSLLERTGFGVCPDNFGTDKDPMFEVMDGDAERVAECTSERMAELVCRALNYAACMGDKEDK